MLHLIAFFAALTVAVGLPTQGDFRVVMRNAQGIGLVDDARVTREGNVATARVVVGFAADIPDRGKMARWAQYVVAYDCGAERMRQMAAASFTRTGEVIEDNRQAGAWEPVPPLSPHAVTRFHVCKGDPAPAAGTDLMVVLNDYWRNPG